MAVFLVYVVLVARMHLGKAQHWRHSLLSLHCGITCTPVKSFTLVAAATQTENLQKFCTGTAQDFCQKSHPKQYTSHLELEQ